MKIPPVASSPNLPVKSKRRKRQCKAIPNQLGLVMPTIPVQIAGIPTLYLASGLGLTLALIVFLKKRKEKADVTLPPPIKFKPVELPGKQR